MSLEVELIKSLVADRAYKSEFLNRIKVNLDQYGIQYDNATLLRLFKEAVASYDNPNQKFFYFSVFLYIKNKLTEQENATLPNNMFSKDDIRILQKALKKVKNRYLSNEEIAKDLGISSTDVTLVLERLENYIKSEDKTIQENFSNVKEVLRKRKLSLKRKSEKEILTTADIKMLGLLTGQVDDICIDIPELAQKNHISTKSMINKVKKAYNLLFDQSNYNRLLERYPDIHDMLLIKAHSLDINLPDFIINNQCKESKQLEEPTESSSNSTSITTADIKKKRKKGQSTIKKDIDFLKDLYQLHDGRYYSIKEIAEKMHIQTKSVYSRKYDILNKMENNSEYKEKIFKGYPNLEEDIRKKETSEDIDFLKDLYQPHDDKYYSIKEIAEKMHIQTKSVDRKRERLLRKLDDNPEYKKKILQEYPALDKDMRKKEISQKKLSKDIVLSKKISKNIDFLKDLYQLHDDKYYSKEEIAKKWNIKPPSVNEKGNLILRKMENNPEYKGKILQGYPNLEEDIRKKETSEDIDFLKDLYQLHDDKYYSIEEIAEKMDIEPSSVDRKRERLLRKLEDNPEYKKKILQEYPNLEEDIRKKDMQKEKASLLNNSEKKVADLLFLDITKVVKKSEEYASELFFSTIYFNQLKGSISAKISENPDISKDYPSFHIEKEILKNYKKSNSITLSEDEINNIQKNVHAYSSIGQKTKQPFFKGIRKLEKSVYKDFVSLCTLEQKAILALRLGFFNHTIFGTDDVADMFSIEKETVSALTNECLKLSQTSTDTSKMVKVKKDIS